MGRPRRGHSSVPDSAIRQLAEYLFTIAPFHCPRFVGIIIPPERSASVWATDPENLTSDEIKMTGSPTHT